MGKILEGGDFFWTSGRNDETKGKNSKQVNEFMLVFVNSEQSLISSVFPLVCRTSTKQDSPSCFITPCCPGSRTFSGLTPDSAFPSSPAELFFASHSESPTTRAAGSTPRLSHSSRTAAWGGGRGATNSRKTSSREVTGVFRLPPALPRGATRRSLKWCRN